MQPQAAKFETSAALAGADSRSLALLTLRVSFRLPHLSITPKGLRHFMAPQALKRAVNHEKRKGSISSMFRCISSMNCHSTLEYILASGLYSAAANTQHSKAPNSKAKPAQHSTESTVQHRTARHSKSQYSKETVPLNKAQHCTAQHSKALLREAQYSTVKHSTTKH
jgi:hypothetical protein